MSFEYIKSNVERIRADIAEAEKSAHREAGSVRMVAAVKYADNGEIDYLCREMGVADIGENRVQQLLSHYEYLSNRDELNWHFIGTLQTNKVKYIIDKVCMIHSLDSEKLAAEIDRQAKKHGIVMDVLVEVNSGEEESKSGVLPKDVESFCLSLGKYENVNLRGFMTMAPKCDEKSDYLKFFQQTYAEVLDIWTKKLHNIGEPIISMGMSDSYREAIACGSDIVRIGRSLFIKN